MRKRLLNLCLTALMSVVCTAAWALSDVGGVYQIGSAADLEAFAQLVNDGQVNANAELYDAILNPCGAVDATQVELTDVPESHEYYEAVRFMFENQVMFPREDGAFSPDDPATVGDFFSGLYMLIGGGTNDPEGCREALASYGLISADQDLDAELREGLLCDILAALGAGITTDDPEAAISRADLADLFMQLTQE